jgi:hypothetical protein
MLHLVNRKAEDATDVRRKYELGFIPETRTGQYFSTVSDGDANNNNISYHTMQLTMKEFSPEVCDLIVEVTRAFPFYST